MRRIRLPRQLTEPAHRVGSFARRAWALRERVPVGLRRAAAVLVVALFGVLLGVQLGGHSSNDVGPFRVDFAVVPSWTGDATVQVPPLGAITVDSHDGPAKLSARIRLLDEQRTRELINDPQRIDAASDDAASDIAGAVKELALSTTLAAITGGLLLGLVVFRNVRRAGITALTSFGLVVAVLGTAAVTYRPEAIREPKYQGLLTNVPAVVGDARSIYDRYGEYRGELIRIVTNMSRVYTNLSSLPVYQPDPNTIRALHVTDLHLNPTSYQVIGAIADQFQVSVIADTGDLTDWGSPVEGQYAQNIGKLGVPYVFIRGNHDSAQTAAAVARQPNAVVLDNNVKKVAGLTFAGVRDPRFTPDKAGDDLGPDEALVRDAGEQLAETVEAYNEQNGTEPPAGDEPAPKNGTAGAVDDGRVDLMLVHDPRTAEPLAEAGPLVLAGHTHKRKISQLDDDTTLMVEGSTGARGLRGIGEKDPTPLQMTLLYFSPTGQLQAYDEITVSGAGQSRVELERKILKR